MVDARSSKPRATLDAGRTGSTAPSATTIGWLGVILTIAGPAGVLLIYLSGRANGGSALAVIGGFLLLGVTLTGLIVMTRAMGLATPEAALGLPPGSVRALLALGLVVVFVGVTGWIMGSKLEANDPRSDLIKQILSVSSTVLVMVIGFYFGSKGASDAASAARGGIKSITDALGIAQPGGGASADTTLSPDSVGGIVNSIKAMAQSTKSKLGQLGDQPLRPLGEFVTKASPAMHEQLSTQVTEAADLLQTMQAQAQTCDSLARNANDLVAGLVTPGAAPTKDETDTLTRIRDDALKANSEFEVDLAKFNLILAAFGKLEASSGSA
jgi:hypothetical protein